MVYWKWISINKLAAVGTKSIYHIDITNGESTPAEKVFERVEQLANCQIMSYDTDATGVWCFLVGLYPNEKKEILSHIQLYNTEKKVTMPLEGYTACFADMPVTDAPGNPKNALFCFCERKANEAHQTLRITEIGNPPAGQAKFKTECQI